MGVGCEAIRIASLFLVFSGRGPPGCLVQVSPLLGVVTQLNHSKEWERHLKSVYTAGSWLLVHETTGWAPPVEAEDADGDLWAGGRVVWVRECESACMAAVGAGGRGERRVFGARVSIECVCVAVCGYIESPCPQAWVRVSSYMDRLRDSEGDDK